MMNRDCRRTNGWNFRLRAAKVGGGGGLAALSLMVALHGGACLLGKPLQALSALRLGWRVTLSAVAVLLTVAALVALPPVALAQTPSAELSALSLSSGTLRPTFAAATTEYRAAVKYNVSQITVTATAASGGTVEYLDATDIALDDADTNMTGFQVDLVVGETAFKVKVTSGSDTEAYTVTVERDSARLFGWTPSRDINALEAAGNASPQGMWSDGTTIWVADGDDDKLYAYTLATGVRAASSDIILHSDNGDPQGIWSDRTTIWVADGDDDKLYAYTLATGVRTASSDISLHADNDAPTGIWSDETTIWVADSVDNKLYAYALSGGIRQDGTGSTTDKEFSLHVDSDVARGIWSDGSTFWVSSGNYTETKRLVAYKLDVSSDGKVGDFHGVPDWDKSFFLPPQLALTDTSIWSDGKTAIWLASTGVTGKIYSFNALPSEPGGVSLSSLTVNDGMNDLGLRPAFNLSEVVYWTAVADNVNAVTVEAAGYAAATVEYLDADADPVTSGHQVNVAVGTTRIDILVTAADGSALIHRVYVERDSARFGGWTPTRDIHGLGVAGNTGPAGAWSDGTTMWVVDEVDDKLYAYTLATRERDDAKEFDLHSDNNYPWGIWSDGETVWVGNNTSPRKLYAYTLRDDPGTTATDEKGQRDADKDITLEDMNTYMTGVWSNGTDTVWVLDDLDDKLYAYTLDIAPDGTVGSDHGDRQPTKDIFLVQGVSNRSIWSNGTIVWVGNNSEDAIQAYTLATGEREEQADIAFPADTTPNGIWSDGSTMWAVNWNVRRYPIVFTRVFSYNLPPLEEGATTLSDLTVTPSPAVASFTAVLRPEFFFNTDLYRVAVPNPAASVTISPTLSDNAATASYQDVDGRTLADADPNTLGHQVNVPVGTYVIDIKVTRTGIPSALYTVVVERDSAERFDWTPTRDLNTFYQDNPEVGTGRPRVVWGDETTLYVASPSIAKIFAFDRSDGARNMGKDIVVSNDLPLDGLGNPESILFAGIWSDGTTMWVVDYLKIHDENGMDTEPSAQDPGHGKVFVYKLVDGERDKSKEFVLDTVHDRSVRGVWSDGTTLWVSDYVLSKLVAYKLVDDPNTSADEYGERDPDKDITLHHLNDSAQGIWSDGTTIWVAQWASQRFFAYTLATGMYDPDKDFDRVPDNIYPRDIWSDGTTLWVPDALTRKLYSYKITERGALLTPSALTVDEGTTGSYTVQLTEAPTGRVTVTVGGTGVTVSPSSLQFTTSNWSSPQTVGVTAGEDANTVDETVTLTHTASGGGYDGVALPALRVTVADNDGGIVANPTELKITEDGSVSGSYGLTLTQNPTSDVTVAVQGTGGKVTVNPATLTFTADDWDTAQTVMVTGVEDADKNDETVTLRHTATGGGYAVTVGSARSAPVVVTVEDDEAMPPDAPDLKLAAGHESAILRWTPGDDGGAPVTKFQYRQGDGTIKDADSLRSHTVTGLENHTEYSFRVRAVNRKGNSVWSEAKTVTPVPLTLTVEAVEDEVTEGEPVRYRIVMSNRTPGAVVESVYSYEGEFVRNSYSRVVSGISSHGGSLSWVVTYDTVDDEVVEADGSFTVTIRRPDPFPLDNGDRCSISTPTARVTRWARRRRRR